MPNPFDQFDAAPAPQSGGLDAVPLPEKPKTPTPQTPMQARKDELDVRKLEAELAKKADPTKNVNFRDPIDKILGVIDAAANAHRMTRQGGLSANPIGRVVGSYIPGTGPRDLSGYLDTIGGNTAFETLQQMRQDSPTGGAVGNVSDADMRLLRSTIASLDPGQGTEKFQKDLATVLHSYQKVIYGLPGGKQAYHEWRMKWLGRAPEKKAPQPKGQKPRVINFDDLPE